MRVRPKDSGGLVTYEDMDVIELRHAYTEALEAACELSRKLAQAYEAGDRVWMTAMFEQFKVADARVRRIKHCLQIGVA